MTTTKTTMSAARAAAAEMTMKTTPPHLVAAPSPEAAVDQADVVCRAGAVTVAELSAGGLASILVPFPYAVDDHQTANARFLAERGAAVLIQQRDVSPEKLAQLMVSLDRAKLLDMAKKARALGKPEAAKLVAQRCMEIAR